MSEQNSDNIETTQPISRVPKSTNIVVGDVVAKRYKILRHLDKGGMGSIYEAEDLSLGRIVALKVMHVPGDQEGQLRFKQEASVAAQLQHPHTVRIFDYGSTDNGALFLVMELLQGHTFKSEFKSKPVEPLRLLLIIRQICGALGEAHEKRIIHRDIKPSNIFITHHDHGFAKLLDFGLVKNLDGKADVSQTGIVLGSPMYMSPEQVDAQPIDQRSDIYSLGMTMYHAACAKPPFKGSLSKILMAQLVREPDKFSELKIPIHVPPLLEWIIFTCIQKDPQNRFQNISQLKKSIEICEEALRQNKTVSLDLVDGELVSNKEGTLDVSVINQTEMYVRPVHTDLSHAQLEKTKQTPRLTPIFLGLALCILAFISFQFLPFIQNKQVVETKTVIQTQVIQANPQVQKQIITTDPEGAFVFWVGDDAPFCTTPCPPILFIKGEERDILLTKEGFNDVQRKLIWNMESPVITLTPTKKITTKTRTKTKTKTNPSKPSSQLPSVSTESTKTKTQVEKKNDGLLKDPFED